MQKMFFYIVVKVEFKHAFINHQHQSEIFFPIYIDISNEYSGTSCTPVHNIHFEFTTTSDFPVPA